MSANYDDCQTELIAAYIDGELDEDTNSLVERHVKQCRRCQADLNEQRLLLCTLNSGLGRGSDLTLPANFARVVAARAESDMSGIGLHRERKLALRLCLLLAAASFALLGTTASIFLPLKLAEQISGILDLAGRTIYDAATGLAIVTRVFGAGVVQKSPVAGFTVLLLLALAVVLLSRLIASYHRARPIE